MAKIVQTAGRNALGEFAPEFAHFNDDVLFGENWNNADIDVKIRSIITGNHRFFLKVPLAECEGSWRNTAGNRSHYYACGVLCRMAESVGSI